MMHDGMGFMMAWMMGIGLLGGVLIVALLATILVVLLRALSSRNRTDSSAPSRTRAVTSEREGGGSALR
jgi:hypothetical protein